LAPPPPPSPSSVAAEAEAVAPPWDRLRLAHTSAVSVAPMSSDSISGRMALSSEAKMEGVRSSSCAHGASS
jgi:hypothetical protein